jgi:hypothetical protein
MTYLKTSYFSELSSGQETMPRALTSTVVFSTGNMRVAFFTARKSETTSQVKFVVTTAAAGGSTGVTACYLGLYSVADDNTMTRIAVTENSTSSLSSTGLKTVSWASSVALVRGRRYALGATATFDSTTVPAINCGLGPGQTEATTVPAIAALISTTSGVPSTSYTAATVNASTALNGPYAVLLP